ncbi:MAG: ABC-F family ATP-binding cassette domain-containing protein, partial [Planctomycetaceae bacterium]
RTSNLNAFSMTVLLQLRDAHKSYGEQTLLDGAECTITDAVKTGFIGRNGAGKSTLLKILLGEDELDRGEVIRHPGLRLGYLRQHDPFEPGESALDFLMRDSGQPDWKCGEVAGQFEIKGQYLDGPVTSLSGGWQTRVKLSALLLQEPNLLLLDEPTNFLDLRTQLLLEQFLRNHDEACLIVSHDRAFLTATCTHTLDLTAGRLMMYPGSIEAHLLNVEEQRQRDERTNHTILAKQRQLQRFIDKNRANANTASQARNKAKQLERLQTTELASELPTASVLAPRVEPRQGPALRCSNLTIGYPEHEVAAGIDVEIEHGSRAAIVGDNGQGKTTFLRTIVGSLDPQSGQLRWGHGCDIGVYAQHVYTSLPEERTVLEYLEYAAIPGTTTQSILKMAGALLFRDSAVRKPVKVLSGGERARLCLAGILLGNHNILVLDEPGNHLDVETVEALCDALIGYRGTVIFTSHDRHFMQRVASCVIEVRSGRVVDYNGDYETYLYAVNKEVDAGIRERTGGLAKTPAEALNSRQSKLRGGDDRKLRKELSKIEKTIARLDNEKRRVNAELLNETDPQTALKLHNEVQARSAELTEAEERWCELQELLGL